MAKKKSSSSSNSTVVGGLSGIFIILLALIAQYFLGIDVLNLDEEGADDNPSAVENVVGGDWYSLYFTEPINTSDRSLHTGSQVEAAVIESINNAETSIDAAFFELGLESIANALIDAKNRGVTVRLVVDDEHMVEEEETHPEDSVLDILEDAGFELYCEAVGQRPSSYDIRCDDRSALMHNKFIIVDGIEVWTGSMNYTHNGVYNNNNNVLLLRSQRMVANYEYIFDLMFEEGNFNLDGTDGYDVPYRRPTVNNVQIENYFSPDDANELEDRISELINDADESIYIIAYGITLDSMGEALLGRVNAGVTVQGIFETRAATAQGSEFPTIGCAGADVRRDGNPNTFHHKAIVIDGEVVITGSFNFSDNAKSNSENVTIIFSEEIAAAYIQEFERRFTDAESITRTEMGC